MSKQSKQSPNRCRFAILAVGLMAISMGCSSSMFQGFGKSEKAETDVPSLGKSRANSGEWLTSFDEAKRLSAETGKPILADFTGSDWCHWCKKLKKEVFDKEQFTEWARDNVILLELDYPKYGNQPVMVKRQNEDLAEQYLIKSYPTVLLLDSEERVLGKLRYEAGGPANFVASVESKLR